LQRIGQIAKKLGVRTPWVFRHPDGKRYLQMDKGLKATARRAGIKDPALARSAPHLWLPAVAGSRLVSGAAARLGGSFLRDHNREDLRLPDRRRPSPGGGNGHKNGHNRVSGPMISQIFSISCSTGPVSSDSASLGSNLSPPANLFRILRP